MKLRNKMTGKVMGMSMAGDIVWVGNYRYKSLAEINEEWEDYNRPKEPLIEDENARNAVYSWASSLQIHQVKCTIIARGLGAEITTFKACELHSAPKIEFAILDADVANGETYTIAELCGEEEE